MPLPVTSRSLRAEQTRASDRIEYLAGPPGEGGDQDARGNLISVSILMLVGGFIYLLAGADLLVRGAVALAHRANVPPIVVALTIVALGTSLPELVVSVQAVFTGYPGIVLGNVVGSNIANVLLVAGVSAIVFPLAYPGGSIRRDSAVMIGVTLFFILLCLNNALSQPAGLALLVTMVIVLIPTIRDAARAQKSAEGQPRPVSALGLPTRRRIISLFIILGLIGLPVGADLVVKGTVQDRPGHGGFGNGGGPQHRGLRHLSTGVGHHHASPPSRKRPRWPSGPSSEATYSTSWPSSGSPALASPWPIEVPESFPHLDLPIMLASALLISAFALFKRPIGRVAGIAFTTLYIGYITFLFVLA